VTNQKRRVRNEPADCFSTVKQRQKGELLRTLAFLKNLKRDGRGECGAIIETMHPALVLQDFADQPSNTEQRLWV